MAEYSGDPDKRLKAEGYSAQALAITSRAAGERHPSTAVRHYNLAVLKCRLGDWTGAANHAERAVAIMLSLDLSQHPSLSNIAATLLQSWEQSGHSEKAACLRSGQISNLLPIIAQIEGEHATWVAEDSENRHFGPPSFFAQHEQSSN